MSRDENLWSKGLQRDRAGIKLITRRLPQWLKVWIIVLSTAFLVAASYEKHQVKSVQSWIPREARITQSELKFRKRQRSSSFDSNQWAEIRGVFLDTQEPFRISRVSFGENMVKSTYKRYVDAYPVGTIATVYVSPENPKEIILNNQTSTGLMTVLQIIFATLVVIGLVSLPRPNDTPARESRRGDS